MFRNYLTVALRNIVRHKLYSFINIAGLAVGLACVIFIVLFVRDELSYDKWLPGTEHLYRLEVDVSGARSTAPGLRDCAFPMPQAMHDEIPEVTRDDPRFQPSSPRPSPSATASFSRRCWSVRPELLQRHQTAAGRRRSGAGALAARVHRAVGKHGAQIFR